uniref:Uncharacterized protein n=2 Tax=Triticum urartu TaxID=4572 RepID=A0A8R7Q922_TRIUA
LRAGRLKAASQKLLDATEAPSSCDMLLFEGSAEKNPMSKENNDAEWLSRVAYAIASLPAPNSRH